MDYQSPKVNQRLEEPDLWGRKVALLLPSRPRVSAGPSGRSNRRVAAPFPKREIHPIGPSCAMHAMVTDHGLSCTIVEFVLWNIVECRGVAWKSYNHQLSWNIAKYNEYHGIACDSYYRGPS